MKVAIALVPRITALDAIGPYEVLQRIPNFEVTFVGHERGEVRTENGMLGLTVDATFEDMPAPDVLLMPGGVGTRTLIKDERVLDWVRRAYDGGSLVTSVCSGALVLAAAGLLDGLTAATHWGVYDMLNTLGATAVEDRVVPHWDRRIVTSAGVSSGIDMALTLAAQLVDETAAKAAQLFIEYDPQPPFDSGSLAKAGPEVLARAKENNTVRA